MLVVDKGTWVQIHKIVLLPNERPETLPTETRKVPLELRVKGFLLASAELGTSVKIRTLSGRIETGTLIAVNPAYNHTFGEFVPELLKIDKIVKSALWGGDDDE